MLMNDPLKKYNTDDLRIKEIKELSPPGHILREFPLSPNAAETTFEEWLQWCSTIQTKDLV